MVLFVKFVMDAEYDAHTYLHKLRNARYHPVGSERESMSVLRGFLILVQMCDHEV